ncbi:cold-shock protein, partial [Vibrio breoganii]
MEGRVVEWNDDRGYGFISSPISHQRLFFHISSVN